MLKRIFIAIVLSMFFISCNKVAEPVTVQSGMIEVSVDPRVELMGIVCYLADYEEYRLFSDYGYRKSIDENFSKWKNHRVVELMKGYRENNFMGYDGPMNMAIHLSNESKGPLVLSEPFPETLDIRWKEIDIDEFTKALKDFRKVSDFDTFFKSNREMYKDIVTQVEDLTIKTNISEWLLSFFKDSDKTNYSLIVSKMVEPNCYGCSVKIDDSLTLSPILHRFNDEYFAPVLVHEYAHGYANRVVDSIWDEIEPYVEEAFKPVSEIMGKKAYGMSNIYMYETLVRAISCVYIKDRFDYEVYEAQLDYEVAESFIWVPELTELFIDEYQNNRERYPDLDSFSPRIVEFVLEQEVKAGSAK